MLRPRHIESKPPLPLTSLIRPSAGLWKKLGAEGREVAKEALEENTAVAELWVCRWKSQCGFPSNAMNCNPGYYCSLISVPHRNWEQQETRPSKRKAPYYCILVDKSQPKTKGLLSIVPAACLLVPAFGCAFWGSILFLRPKPRRKSRGNNLNI